MRTNSLCEILEYFAFGCRVKRFLTSPVHLPAFNKLVRLAKNDSPSLVIVNSEKLAKRMPFLTPVTLFSKMGNPDAVLEQIKGCA
jgi:hypothetical protein